MGHCLLTFFFNCSSFWLNTLHYYYISTLGSYRLFDQICTKNKAAVLQQKRIGACLKSRT